MFNKITDRQNEEERQERRLGRHFSVFFVVLIKRVLSVMVLAVILTCIVVWGSAAVFETAKEEKIQLVLTEDGYYEIGTAKEYMEFWRIVQREDVYARGRLMKDITFNDPDDYMEWKEEEPANKSPEVEIFYGTFDGNGHTIYGLYSDTGYGLVERNRGQILNLSIKNSMICSEDSEAAGGICKENYRLIKNCRFSGELCIGGDKASLISTEDICGKNNGEIVNFYSDVENSKDLYDLLVKEKGIGNWFKGVAEKKQPPGPGFKLEDPFPGTLDRIAQREEEEQRIVREALKQEEISMLIREVVLAKGEDWKSLEMETEVLEDRVSLQLSDGAETVAINIFFAQAEQKQENLIPGDGSRWEEFKALWQQCGAILHEEGIDDYERYSWHMTDVQRGRETLGKFILYQTAEEKQGFFRQNGGVLYQIETRGGSEDGDQDKGYLFDIQEMKTQIKGLSVTNKKNREQHEWRKPNSGLYETMLWKLWDGRMPARYVGWDSDAIRDAVYKVISTEEGMPAWEEMEEIEYLSVSLEEKEQIETLLDLEKLPHLKELQLNGNDQTQINFDLTKGMIPELEELSIRGVELENLAFLEDFPQLKNLYVIDCGLGDISGIECQKELRDISFFQNTISDISPLESCKKVEVLSLAFNEIKDISALASMTELSEAGIYGNKISDISPLQHLTKLRRINLNANRITDLSPLRDLTELTGLGASYNQISDISPLEGQTKLDNLALDYNEIQDIRVLGNMLMLRYLGLYHNQIKDFTPVAGHTQLLFCSVGENPGQDHIGDLVFLPRLVIGSGFSGEEEMQQEVQEILDRFYPDEGLIPEDMVRGDLNGDGIADLAITGLEEEAYGEYEDERKVYLFLRQTDGSLRPLTPVDTLEPHSGGVYGDPYEGILITDGKLMVKVYGGSNWRWGYTNIYQYENGEMKEKWEMSIEENVFCPGYAFCITNAEDGSYRQYVIAGEWEGESRQLLIAQGGEGLSPVKNFPQEREFAQKYAEYQERTGITFPEFNRGIGRPSISTGYYDYQLHDQLYNTQRLPEKVLMEAAEKYLTEYQELPLPYYTSEEILENYKTLTGIELPEILFIGKDKSNPEEIEILAYEGCQQNEDGSFEHKLSLWQIRYSDDEEIKTWECKENIYYDERDEIFSVG